MSSQLQTHPVFLSKNWLQSIGVKFWWRCLPIGVAALITIGLFSVGVGQSLEHAAYGALFRMRGALPWSDQIVVVEIDDASIEQLGALPWSNQHYLALLQQLSAAEPSVIALNIPLPVSEIDLNQLAVAIARQGRVVLAQPWNPQGLPTPLSPALQQTVAGVGHVYPLEDADGMTRVVEPHRHQIPALGVAVMQVYAKVTNQPFHQPSQQLLWINWAGSTQSIPRYSSLQVIQGQVAATALRDKIVLVGSTAAGAHTLTTPFDRNSPTTDIYLQAAVIHNLLTENSLHAVVNPVFWLVLCLGTLGLNWGVRSWRHPHQFLVWIGLCLGWSAIALLLFQSNYWIPVAAPILFFGLVGGSTSSIEQLQRHVQLRRSEERYALAARGSNEGLWDWDLRTNRVYFSPRWQTMLGWQDGDIGDRPQDWFDRVHPDDRVALKAAISDYLQSTLPQFQHEYRMQHQDGSFQWMLSRALVVRDRDGNAVRMVGSQADITERKRAEEQLRRNAFFDSLTNLPNRAGFIEHLQQAIERTQNYPRLAFAVLWVDLDRFKMVNNSLGSEVGDRLLAAIAQRLRAFLSPEDVIARVGGDEFTILLNQVQDAKDAAQNAARVQQVLSLPFNLDGREVFVSASIGIALSSIRYTQPEHLLRDADTAMHRAKDMGKARCLVFDQTMHTRMLTRLQLENDLRRAIAQGERSITTVVSNEPEIIARQPTWLAEQELMLHYQPIVQLTTGQLTGFEALIRWRHPDQGLLSPAYFIPMAEETGLIVPLGWWILRTACLQMRQWQVLFPNQTNLTVNVNLSSHQFSLSGLTEQIRQILQETNLDPSHLKLEMTESTVMENAGSVVNMLHQIRALGIQLAIDDFGTGYSSLSYLHRFPINSLKIDRSFVGQMETGSENAEIVRTILMLAHNLGMDVTAEGVETAGQSTQLLNMACEYGQGFFFSKPVDASVATHLLLQQYAPVEKPLQLE